MSASFARRFAAARDLRGPLVLGADPHGPLLRAWGLTDDADGLERFTDILLEAAVGTAGIIKPQSAFFERHGWRGARVLTRLVSEARSAGLLVILDVKRGDVATTNEAYAQAYLGDGAPIQSDAITVHPYLGLAAMDSYIDRAQACGACLLVVTRSSNPEGQAIPRAITGRGGCVAGQILTEIGAINTRLAPGEIGPVGAVIGVAPGQPELDLPAAGALFLVPGVGAQGATPPEVARTFESCPDRVLPSASRSLLAAGPDAGALGDAVMRLNEEFSELLAITL